MLVTDMREANLGRNTLGRSSATIADLSSELNIVGLFFVACKSSRALLKNHLQLLLFMKLSISTVDSFRFCLPCICAVTIVKLLGNVALERSRCVCYLNCLVI